MNEEQAKIEKSVRDIIRISDFVLHIRKKKSHTSLEQHDGAQKAKFNLVNYPFSAAVCNDKYRLHMTNSQSSLQTGRTL